MPMPNGMSVWGKQFVAPGLTRGVHINSTSFVLDRHFLHAIGKQIALGTPREKTDGFLDFSFFLPSFLLHSLHSFSFFFCSFLPT